jgi:CRP-like cAMP-binding protein
VSTLDRIIAVLSAHPYFSALERDELRILAFSSDRSTLKPGARLYNEGAPADSAFVVLSGELKLEVGRAKMTTVIGSAPVGTLLGETALILQTSRQTSAIAAGEVEVLRIQRAVFRRLLEEYPAAAAEIHHRLSERLLDLTGSLEGVRRRLIRPGDETVPLG